MTELRCEMTKLMQLRDLSENTQRTYLRAVSGLAMHYKMQFPKISLPESRSNISSLVGWLNIGQDVSL